MSMLVAALKGVPSFDIGSTMWTVALCNTGVFPVYEDQYGGVCCVRDTEDEQDMQALCTPDGFQVTEDEARRMSLALAVYVKVQRFIPDEETSLGPTPRKIGADWLPMLSSLSEWLLKSGGFSIR